MLTDNFVTMEIGKAKHIALVAHDGKKKELIEWCDRNKEVLQGHFLCGTGTTARLIAEKTGLPVKGYCSGYSGDQYEHCDLTWYGRSVVYRSFPYSGERSDGSAISFLGDHYRNHNRSRNVCAGSDRGSCDDCDDLFVLS